jgi:hypothetical protein
MVGCWAFINRRALAMWWNEWNTESPSTSTRAGVSVLVVATTGIGMPIAARTAVNITETRQIRRTRASVFA